MQVAQTIKGPANDKNKQTPKINNIDINPKNKLQPVCCAFLGPKLHPSKGAPKF